MKKKLFEEMFNDKYTKLKILPGHIELIYNPLFKKENKTTIFQNDQLIAIFKQVAQRKNFFNKINWEKDFKDICNDFEIFYNMKK